MKLLNSTCNQDKASEKAMNSSCFHYTMHLCRKAALFSFLFLFFLLLTPGHALYGQAEPDVADPAIEELSEVVGRDLSIIEVSSFPGKTGLEISEMEQSYDRFIEKIMEIYYDPSTFLVDTSLELTLLAQRKLEGVQQMREEVPIIQEDLPGIPSIPEFLLRQRTRDGDIRDGEIIRFDYKTDIRRIQIELTVDPSYTDMDIGFIERLLSAAVKLDPGRGDVINFTQHNFPTRRVVPSDTLPQVDALSTALADQADLQERRPDEATPAAQAAQWASQNLWPLLIALAILLLSLLLLWLLFRRRRKEEEKAKMADLQKRSEETKELTESETSKPFSPEEDLDEAGIALNGFDEKPESYLLKMLTRHSADMARLFEHWVMDNGNEGIQKAQLILLKTDAKLLRLLRPVMSEKAYQTLENKIRMNAGAISQNGDLKLKEIQEDIKRREHKDSLVFQLRTLRDFDFLDYTDNALLASVLNNLSPENASVVLGHMDSRRVTSLMKNLSREKQSTLWNSLPFSMNVTLEEYQHVSEQFFLELQRQMNVQYLPAGLVEQSLAIIESMPVEQQNLIIEQFRENPSPLGDALTKKLITVEQLDQIPMEVLAEALEGMDTYILGKALSALNPDTAKLILSAKPKREQAMLGSLMEDSESYTSDEIESALRNLLHNVRSFVRTKKGRLSLESKTEGSA